MNELIIKAMTYRNGQKGRNVTMIGEVIVVQLVAALQGFCVKRFPKQDYQLRGGQCGVHTIHWIRVTLLSVQLSFHI